MSERVKNACRDTWLDAYAHLLLEWGWCDMVNQLDANELRHLASKMPMQAHVLRKRAGEIDE